MTGDGSVDTAALAVFIALFLFVTVLGFVAARWRRGNLDRIEEWGLGGRKFGTVVTWFLLGGDVYTAYTFIAVPALVFAAGAVGFFALPYTIVVYMIVFLIMPRLWGVARRHGYVTPADFVRGRYRSGALAVIVAFTGFLATMPYIALQLVGIQVVLAAMGIEGELPIIIAFAILAAYTYTSGLRAPALVAVVKDTLIYVTVLVAVIYIPTQLGGFGEIFAAAEEAVPEKPEGSFLPTTGDAQTAYATLILGSALALFLYPHVITAVLSASSQKIIRRNAVILPAYTLLLGLIALLGYMAIAAGLQLDDPNFAVPALFTEFFPGWFEGFAFAAIAIGALVPAAVMSIAAANLFTRNVYKQYVRPDCSEREETQVAKITSLVVKVGALAFVIFLPNQYAIDLQLLGGVFILQTLPALVVGLYTRWMDKRALLVGWAVGMVVGLAMAASQDFGPVYPLEILGTTISAYTAIFALLANLVVSVLGTVLLRALGRADEADETRARDYDEFSEAAERGPEPVAG